MNEELKELTDLNALEVSLVHKGANKKKRFPVTKNKESEKMEDQEILEAVLKTEIDEEAELSEYFEKMKLSPKGQNAAKAALRMLNAYKDELPSDILSKLADAVGYPAPKMKAKKEDEYPNPKDEENMEKKEIKKEESSQVEPEEIKKAKDEIAELRSKNEAVEKALKAETDKRELDEWVRKAETDLSHYPGKSSKELGEILKGLSDVNPELASAQFETMKKASDALRESNVLKEAGREFGDGPEGSTWEKVCKMADGIVEKSEDLTLTREKAIAAIFERQPELYTKYLEEHPEQEGRSAR